MLNNFYRWPRLLQAVVIAACIIIFVYGILFGFIALLEMLRPEIK